MGVQISVIIPVYNVEKYIKRCVDSVLRQTHTDLEIILVNDGSTDNSGSICDEYASRDSRVKVIHKANGGLSSARNAGIDIATGDYIGFVDSDDFIDTDMYRILLDAMLENEADISVGGYYELSGNKLKLSNDMTKIKVYTADGAIEELLYDRAIKSHAGDKLYKKSLFDGIRYPVGKTMEDICTTYKLFERAGKVIYIGNALYYYMTDRAESITNKVCVNTIYNLFEAHLQRYGDLAEKYPQSEGLLFSYIALCALRFLTQYHTAQRCERNKLQYTAVRGFIKDNYSKVKANGYIERNTKLRFILARPAPWGLNGFDNFIAYLKSIKLRKVYTFFHVGIRNLLAVTKNYKAYKRFYDQIKGKRKIFLIGSPQDNNLGDHAIALTERAFLEQSFPDRELIELSGQMFQHQAGFIKKYINDDDLITLAGGGDLGNQYLWIEECRRSVMKHFKNNKIVLFPQTAYFTEDHNGSEELAKSIKTYGRCKNLTLFAREEVSFQFLLNHFKENKVGLCPDIVFLHNKSEPCYERGGALLCLRSDLEGKLAYQDILSIRHKCLQAFGHVDVTDTCHAECIMFENRQKMVDEKLVQFKKSELVITDRLHGLVFAAITGTPCIAVGNYNHKVAGIYEWVKSFPYVKYVNAPEDVSADLLREMKNIDRGLYGNEIFSEYYSNLKSSME